MSSWCCKLICILGFYSSHKKKLKNLKTVITTINLFNWILCLFAHHKLKPKFTPKWHTYPQYSKVCNFLFLFYFDQKLWFKSDFNFYIYFALYSIFRFWFFFLFIANHSIFFSLPFLFHSLWFLVGSVVTPMYFMIWFCFFVSSCL